jgi:hypothetical protein
MMPDQYRKVVMYDENYDTPVIIAECKTEDIAVEYVDRISRSYPYAHIDITDKYFPPMPIRDKVYFLKGILEKENTWTPDFLRDLNDLITKLEAMETED